MQEVECKGRMQEEKCKGRAQRTQTRSLASGHVRISSLTRIPPGQGFWDMVCGVVGLWFVVFGTVWKNVDAKLLKIQC